MLKKFTLAIFMLTCAFLASASAQTQTSPEKQAAIKELVALINGDNKMQEIMDALVPQMQAMQDAQLKSMLDARADLTQTERQSLEEAIVKDKKYSLKRLMDRFTARINYNELLNEIGYAVYDKYYTLEEIKDINAFYKTATGQKTLKLMTPVSVDAMRMQQERIMPAMMNVVKELMD